jgi:hypothetical protein
MNENLTTPYPEDFELDAEGNTIAFDGNSALKKSNTKLPWTENHIKEWLKCRDDIFYFAERYHHVLDIDTGLHKIQMRDYQRDMITSFQNNRFNIVLAARQIGKSTSFEIYVLHYLLFNKDKTVAILANKEANAVDILRKIKQAYELLPKWLQQGVRSWNSKSIRLENGSYAFASSTSSSAIRGRSVSCLIIDECIAGESMITVRNKKTGLIEQISIENFYEKI